MKPIALIGVSIATALALASSLPALAHEAHAGQHGAKAPERGIELRLADAPLKDQDGRDLRLKSDLLGKRVTVVNFVYTTCTTVCPVSSATLAALQSRLGPRLDDRVQLVSITVDPQRDTPARLKEYAAKYGASASWRWLTGRKADVDLALKGFGAYTVNYEDHPSMILIGDAEGQRWTRLYGFPSVDELAAQVDLALGRSPRSH